MDNNPCIILAVGGNRLLVNIQGVPAITCSPNEYAEEPRLVSEINCDSHIGSATLPGASKVLGSARICSQPYHNHSDGPYVPVIGDASYSVGRPDCPPKVRYTPEIDAFTFTLHILSDTPVGSQWLKSILLMDSNGDDGNGDDGNGDDGNGDDGDDDFVGDGAHSTRST